MGELLGLQAAGQTGLLCFEDPPQSITLDNTSSATRRALFFMVPKQRNPDQNQEPAKPAPVICPALEE
ncbi:MAG: hypothetical protein JXR37_29715 [Kiritimatiellae bacterium]|nr:hypothetical protein [Kiritimatiellia bacterium]